nr:9116_t:CDS:2 [Entrophospora candida]
MPPIKHSLTEYIIVLNEKANKYNHYALCRFCKTKLTNTKKLVTSHLKNYKEHWEKLVLNSTIDNGWSFRWVDKKSSQILFNFATAGLKLPSHKILAGFDGWKNIKKQEILGSVLITSHGQVLIWGGEDVSRNRLQWQNIKELSLNFLDKLDELNIKYNAMITDSASQNQAARKRLAPERRDVFFGPCFAHQTNLIVGEIFKESSSLVVSSEKAIQIISFLNRSVYFMAKLRDEQKFKYNKYFALLLPCATRWNSHYHCYSSLLRTKFALKMLVSKYAPIEYEADDNYTGNDENDRKMPLEICRIVDDEDWWRDIKKLEKLLLPFCGALNKLQTDNARLHDVLHCFAYFYKMWKEYPDQNLGAGMIIRLEKRWQIWEQPLLLLSFILHPEYRDKIFLQNNTSISIAKLSEWMIYYFCVWFKKAPDTLLGELQNYRRQNFPFHNISLKQFNDGVLGFWDFVSAYTPDLSMFSIKVFAICVNTASVERLFSAMDFFHTKKRNRLDSEKVFAMSQMKGEFQRLERLENIQNSNKKFKTTSIAIPIIQEQTDELFMVSDDDDDRNDEFFNNDFEYSEHDIESPREWRNLIDEWIEMDDGYNDELGSLIENISRCEFQKDKESENTYMGYHKYLLGQSNIS